MVAVPETKLLRTNFDKNSNTNTHAFVALNKILTAKRALSSAEKSDMFPMM